MAYKGGEGERRPETANEEKRMTIIIKALSFPKCEGFIRLNPNVIFVRGLFQKLSGFVVRRTKYSLNSAP